MLCSFRVVVTLVYYGLVLGSSDLAGSPFLNVALSGLVELPACLFVYLTLDRFGRRVIQAGSLAVSGVACLMVTTIPTGEWENKYIYCREIDNVIDHVCQLYSLASYPDLTWLIITLTLAGKFFVSVGFPTIFIYTAEMYPTPIRAIGLGASSMFARVGSLLAPFVVELVSLQWIESIILTILYMRRELYMLSDYYNFRSLV